MITTELRHLYYDFRISPQLIDQYANHMDRQAALRTTRQVTTVTHYLSRMAVGETRIQAGVYFGVFATCLDELTDEQQEKIGEQTIRRAFRGDYSDPSLAIAHPVATLATGPRFEEAICHVTKWQNRSLQQCENPSASEIRKITREKGGWSGLGSIHLVKADVSEEEDEFMFEFGYTLQLLDDYFDTHRDHEEGIKTLFTEDVYHHTRLAERLVAMKNRARELWGSSPAHRRFFTILRLHLFFGRTAHTGRPFHKLVPWSL